jgi:hypothetical protein
LADAPVWVGKDAGDGLRPAEKDHSDDGDGAAGDDERAPAAEARLGAAANEST